MIDTLSQDVRFGIRTLIGKPGFALTALLVLAVGIGANTAVFSLLNALLLKPLRIEKAEQIVGCFSRDTKRPDTYRAFSYPNYVDVREKNRVFTSLAAHDVTMVGLTEGDTTKRVFADVISSNYFATLGVPLARGRTFSADEERPEAGIAAAIASYPLWKKRGGDPHFLGSTLRINGRVFTVVGIAAEGFTGTTALLSPELYLPLGMFEAVMNDFEGHARPLAARDNHALILVGRLKPGVTRQAADAQLAGVASQMEQAYPVENKNQTFVVHRLSRASISDRPVEDTQLGALAMLLSSMAGAVLLIASLNVANMMLARATARRKEIAMRLALGAGRRRIVQQLFTEALLLAVLGGAAGLVLAYWGTTLLVHSLARLAPFDLAYSGGPDVRVMAATMAFCLVSTLLFGLWPAWGVSRMNVGSDIRSGESDRIGGAKLRRVFSRRNVLVMSQICLSLVLLTAAGLFMRSSMRAAHVQPGFRIQNGAIAEIDPSLAGYDEARGRRIYGELLDKLRAMPGVESASVAATVPFGMITLDRGVQRESDAPASKDDTMKRGDLMNCRFNIVGMDYFRTLGIPLLQGRFFNSVETGNGRSARVAILDRLTAERLWPKGEAVGKRIRMLSGAGNETVQDAEVIGVVAPIQESILGAALEPHLYVPFGQEYQADMTIHLKLATGDPEAQKTLLRAVRREIHGYDDRLPVLELRTLREHLDASFDLWLVATGARIFMLFGGLALLVAAIGLYGVRAYTVARRTREIGVRMAVGANARGTLLMILREGAVVTAIGMAAGLVLSAMAGKVLSGFLYAVSGIDPVVLVTAPVVLAAVSLVACYFPARRAAHVDPMTALRYE